ncbi:MAG TPA: diacylglycerol kinase family protein [Thermoanaerobaculia bacterium]
MPKGTLFFNPSSGAKLPEEEVLACEKACREAGLDFIPLTRELDLAKTIRERMDQGQRLFVAAGGDGTIHHVVQPLVSTDAVLGVIPAGTYNHFARDLGLPLAWREALEVIVSGTTRQVDVARVNDHYFVNNVSLGLYPELVKRREAKGRDYPRWKARMQALVGTLRKFSHVTLSIETAERQELLHTHVFIVSNNGYDLSRIGVEAPRESLDDGLLSVYWLPKLSRWRMMRFAGRYLAGRVRHTPGFRNFRTKEMRVQSPKAHLSVGIDGEVFMLTTPIEVTILPQSLSVRVLR